MEDLEVNREKFSRQFGLFDPELYKDRSVTVVGCGGIGSNAAFCLAKMGISNLTLIDMDTVERANLGSQFFTESDIGKQKSEALAEKLKYFCGNELIINPVVEFANQSMDRETDILVFALDSIDSRRSVFLSRSGSKSSYLIDARMGSTGASFFMMSSEDRPTLASKYIESLNRPVTPLPCAEKAIVFTVFTIAGIIGSGVRNAILGKKNPFEQFYDMEQMIHIKVVEAESSNIVESLDVSKPRTAKRKTKRPVRRVD